MSKQQQRSGSLSNGPPAQGFKRGPGKALHEIQVNGGTRAKARKLDGARSLSPL
jgi:hypothetical protein